MDIADLIIMLLIIGMLFRGTEIGFIRQLCTAVGFVGGIFIGAFLTPHIISHGTTPAVRSVWTLFITLGCGIVLLSIGEYVGIVLKQKALKPEHSLYKQLSWADGLCGALLGAFTLLATVWLSAIFLIKLPYASVVSEIQQSVIISYLDKNLPAAPNILADLGHLIDPNGFPQVFIGSEPVPLSPVTLPSVGSFQAVANADSSSVVKVEGLGCGGIVEGSGFVAGPGLIITNAHVVAGVASPYIIDNNGRHSVKVIWFDPNFDLAVLSTTNLAGKPLFLDDIVANRGTTGVIMGYPGGGGLSASPAAVLDEFNATGRNIYNEGATDRAIYELQANVIPGNSGGPIINADGQVFGIVFAESTVYNHVGYALTMSQVISEFNQAQQQNQVVGTGSCAE